MVRYSGSVRTSVTPENMNKMRTLAMPRMSRRELLMGLVAMSVPALIVSRHTFSMADIGLKKSMASAAILPTDGDDYFAVVHPSWGKTVQAEVERFRLVLARYERRFGKPWQPPKFEIKVGQWEGVRFIESE